MRKIEVLLDAECEEEWPEAILNKVTVEMMDGRIHTSENSYYYGHFKQPMKDDDIEKKFFDLTKSFLTNKQQVNALETLWNLENIEVLSEVFRLLVIVSAVLPILVRFAFMPLMVLRSLLILLISPHTLVVSIVFVSFSRFFIRQ